MTTKRFALVSALVLAWPSAALAGGGFAYDPPGQLVTGSGKGRVDTNVYAPGIRYPMESGPAYANSQVWGHGGTSGPANSDQCDAENFQYPWHDNYCETRDYSMPLCPAGVGHQGQDNRAADCKKDVHTTVAVVDGTITNIGSYSVYLTRDDGVRFDYLHMSNLLVKVGDKVKQGQPIGKVSNHFGTSTTTVHLHFNIFENVAGVGAVYVPPYTTLIQAYQELMGLTTPDAGPPPPPPAPTNEETPTTAPPPAPTTDPPPSEGGGCAVAPHDATLPAAALLALLVLAAKRRRKR